jgi:hypothetical protein
VVVSIRALVKGKMRTRSKESLGAAAFVLLTAALAVWFLVKALT